MNCDLRAEREGEKKRGGVSEERRERILGVARGLKLVAD